MGVGSHGSECFQGAVGDEVMLVDYSAERNGNSNQIFPWTGVWTAVVFSTA